MAISNSQQALNQLTAYKSKTKDPQTILAEANKRYDVEGVNGRIRNLRGSIVNTENLLNGVDDSVTGRTSGTLTTEAQRSRIVNMERAPISETLATQQGGLSQEQQTLGDVTGQANTEAQLAYGGQQDQLTYLKGIYDTLFQREQAAADARRQEQARQDALAEAARSRAANAALASIGAGGGGAAPKAPAATDPLAQIAYNDVRTRVSQQSDAALKSDYNVTALSASYGNAKDKLKLTYYKKLRPDIFGNYTPPKAVPKPKPKPSVKQQVKTWVTQPGPSHLSTGNASNNLHNWFGWTGLFK